jgi:hypothetical protein
MHDHPDDHHHPGAMPLAPQLREYTPLVVYAKSYRLMLLLDT